MCAGILALSLHIGKENESQSTLPRSSVAEAARPTRRAAARQRTDGTLMEHGFLSDAVALLLAGAGIAYSASASD